MAESRKRKSAAELMNELEANPAFIARRTSSEQERLRLVQEQTEIERPIIDDLRQIGFHVSTLDELRKSGQAYSSAIPVLLSWLHKIQDSYERESIIRALSVPWARGYAERQLLDLYRSLDDERDKLLKWATANAISIVVVDIEYLDELLSLITDQTNGSSSQMIVRGMHRFKNERVVDALVGLVGHPVLTLAAMSSLGKLGAAQALPVLRPYLENKNAALRSEAIKALSRINRKLKRPPGSGIPGSNASQE